jgi:hypothetical protein
MRRPRSNAYRSSIIRAWLLVWLTSASLSALFTVAIPGAASPQESVQPARLLSREEGRTIVNTALEHEQRAHGKLDCSHLVNQIYLLAGFAYPYASSFDLYAGNQNFRRVRNPQPGDLIVWPGHIGIVLDPAQHTFYSSVRSGLQAEFYDGPYWRARGKPRFYRYVFENPDNFAGAKFQAASSTSGTRVHGTAGRAVEEDSGVSLSDSKHQGRVASESTAAVAGSSVPGDAAATFETPPSILIATAGEQPTRDEVAQAISELSNAAGDLLHDDPLKPRLPVVIFDQINVERVQTKGDRGWAHVRIDSEVSLPEQRERVDLKRHHEEVRWELRRTESGWAAIRPTDRAYVPRDVAVRIFAQQLARLANNNDRGTTESAAIAREEAQLASLLDDLLKQSK